MLFNQILKGSKYMNEEIYDDRLTEEQWRSFFGGNNDKEFEGFCKQGLYPLLLNNSF